MRTIETKIYKFNELNDEAKEKAISDHRVFEQEQFNPDLDYYKEQVESKGFKNAKIFYSGFCSQGDGASFDCEIDLIKFITDNKKQLPLLYKILNSKRNLYDYIEANIEKNSYANHNSHKKTRYTEVVIQNVDKRIESVLIKEVAMLEEFIEIARLSACDLIYNGLEKEWNDINSDECIKETIEANEYEFFATGKIYFQS